MPKFTFDERNKIKTIVATLTLKRVSDNEIIKEIEKQTGKIITRQYLYNLRHPNQKGII